MENENAFEGSAFGLTEQEHIEAALGLSTPAVEKAVEVPAVDEVMAMPPDSDELSESEMRAAAEKRQADAVNAAAEKGDQERAIKILDTIIGKAEDDEPIALPEDSE